MLQLLATTAVLANNGIKHKPRLVIGTQDTVTRVLHPLQPQAAKLIHPPTWPWCGAGRRHPGRHVGQVFSGAGYLSVANLARLRR
jgi:penicillin-binding protein 2